MKVFSLQDFKNGWFLGDFSPSVMRSEGFEVGVLTHLAGERWPAHFHRVSKEINVLLSGKMIVCGKEINPSEIFIFEPLEIADPVFLEDCKVLCIKVPSAPGDKVIIGEDYHE